MEILKRCFFSSYSWLKDCGVLYGVIAWEKKKKRLAAIPCVTVLVGRAAAITTTTKTTTKSKRSQNIKFRHPKNPLPKPEIVFSSFRWKIEISANEAYICVDTGADIRVETRGPAKTSAPAETRAFGEIFVPAEIRASGGERDCACIPNQAKAKPCLDAKIKCIVG